MCGCKSIVLQITFTQRMLKKQTFSNPKRKNQNFVLLLLLVLTQDELGDEAIGDGRWLVDLEASPHPDEVNLVAELPDEVLRLLDGHCRRPGNGTASWRPSAPGS